MMSKQDSRQKFFKIYANLPIQERENVIAVMPETGAISWKLANLEISENTDFGDRILEKLEKLKLI